MEKVHFNEGSKTSAEGEVEMDGEGDGDEDEDDYSASVSAILLRRASSKRQPSKRRRPSSALTPDGLDLLPRRRSSNVTTTSAETAISIDEGTTQEHIFQNIKLHKEVLGNVKQQPWPMRRKMKLVNKAKNYVKKHEGELQERLAQSKTTRDMLACCDIIFVKEWQFVKRELANLMNVMVPWELRIKEIESHFGSVVASYFTFLRWLFWVNLVIALILITFVAIPEILTADKSNAGERKEVLDDEKATATNFMTLWDFEGALKYSPIFYGYYSSQEHSKKGFGYKGPLAYFITGLAVYIYSFVATLRRMAENSRQSKLSEKDDECVFTWKLFTGWDYMIGNSETAHNRTASIILGFKEALLEEAEKKRDERSWKMVALRIFTNINVLWLLASSVYAVVLVVERSTKQRQTGGWWQQNEVTIVVSLITNVFPFIFEMLGSLEQYHPRKRLRMQLARIMVLNLLNLYTFILASFSKISDMSIQLQNIKKNLTNISTQPSELVLSKQGVVLTSSFTTAANDLYTNMLNASQPSTSSPCYVQKVNCTTYTIPNETSTQSPSTSSLSTSTTEQSYTASTLTALLLLSTVLSNNGTSSDVNATDLSYRSLGNDSEDYSTRNISMRSQRASYKQYDYDSDDAAGTVMRAGDGSRQERLTDTQRFILPVFVELFNYNKDTNETSDDDFLTPEDYPDENNTYIKIDDENNTSTALNVYRSTTDSYTTDDGCLYVTVCPDVPSSMSAPTSTAGSQSSVSVSTMYFIETTENKAQTTIMPPLPDADFPIPHDYSLYTKSLDIETRRKLRSLCWETMFGQELVKLTVMDLVLTIVSTLLVDFIRAIFVRTMNNCWCWDLEKKFPQYGDFKIAENILHLVNNQGMVWMGMFFSPGLPLINLIKLVIMMYLRSWTVLTCNVPHEVVFRASSSNNFYLALLLTMLFLCVLPVSYAIVWVRPSWHCGPFSNYEKIYFLFTNSTKKALPSKTIHKALDYIASPGIVIPLLVLLVLIIYYLISLTSALREANNDLKVQLRRERTEERRKVFQMVDRRHRAGGPGDLIESTPFQKWQKTLNVLPNSKSDQTSINAEEGNGQNAGNVIKTDAKKLLSKLTKHTTQKHINEENIPIMDADGTDIEQVESLPDDRIVIHNGHLKKADTDNAEVHKTELPTTKKSHDEERKRSKHDKQDRYENHNRYSKDNEKPEASDQHKYQHKGVKYSKSHGWNEKKSKTDNESHKHERKDSATSVLSDQIPEIRISQSTDDESQQETKFKSASKSSSADTIIVTGAVEQIETFEDADKATKKPLKKSKTPNERSGLGSALAGEQGKHHKKSKTITTVADGKREKITGPEDVITTTNKLEKPAEKVKGPTDENVQKLKQKHHGTKLVDTVNANDRSPAFPGEPERTQLEKASRSDSRHRRSTTDTDNKSRTRSKHSDAPSETKGNTEVLNESEEHEEDATMKKKKKKHTEARQKDSSSTHHVKPEQCSQNELSFKLKSKLEKHTDGGSQRPIQTTEPVESREACKRTDSDKSKRLREGDKITVDVHKDGTEHRNKADTIKQKEKHRTNKERREEPSRNIDDSIAKDKSSRNENIPCTKKSFSKKLLETISDTESIDGNSTNEQDSSEASENNGNCSDTDNNEKDIVKAKKFKSRPPQAKVVQMRSDSRSSHDEPHNYSTKSKAVPNQKYSSDDGQYTEPRPSSTSSSDESYSRKDNGHDSKEETDHIQFQHSEPQSPSLNEIVERQLPKDCSNNSVGKSSE